MATTASGFWYPDEGTAFNINTMFSVSMSSVETKVGPHIMDTGWVDCPLVSGTTQQGASLPQVRRIGKKVYMRWGVNGTGKAANSISSVCTIPVGFRPVEYKYFTATSASANTIPRIVVRTDGAVVLYVPSTTSSYYIFDVAHWTID